MTSSALRALPALVAIGALLLTGCTSPDAPVGTDAGAAPTSPQSLAPVRVLQLNLCNSGIAGCFTGEAPRAAADAVREASPDLITLNEVCDGDIALVERTLAEVTPGGEVGSAFRAARNGVTGEPYTCRNGQQYGNGVVARGAAAGAPTSDVYPDQDPEDPEQRVWLCLDTASPLPGVCTTHLAYTDLGVALAQCRHMVGSVLTGRPPAVLAADLNLLPGGTPGVEDCVPPGRPRVDDGGPQNVVGPPGTAVAGTRLIDMRGTTDHPGLVVDLVPAAPPPGGSMPG